VDFVVGDDGEVRLRPGGFDARELQGMLHKAGRKPVSLASMDAAIRSARVR
jgi:hypothetical protein